MIDKFKKFEQMKKFDFEDDGWVDNIPATKMYVIQEIESGKFIYKPSQWGNTLTDDPRKAKTYTSEAMAKNSLTLGGNEDFHRKVRGKWRLVEVERVVLGNAKEIEF